MPPIKTVFAIQFIKAKPRYKAPVICNNKVGKTVDVRPIEFKISPYIKVDEQGFVLL